MKKVYLENLMQILLEMNFKKRNNFLQDSDMENIFVDRFLNNLSISDEEKNFIMKNTFAKVQILDPVRGNNILCTGRIAQELN